jgi:hypothetical protein
MAAVENRRSPQRIEIERIGMLLISPVVFSGWFVRFFDNAYEPEIENVRA